MNIVNKMSSTKVHHHHPHHRHAPFIHDLGLMNWLIGIWLGIVIAGFMFDRGIQFARDHSLFPSFSTSFAPIYSEDDAWIHLESHGDVDLMYRTIVPTMSLHAHRAVVVADLPIEALLHVFRDTPNHVRTITLTHAIELVFWQLANMYSFDSFESQIKWAKDLKESEEYQKSGAHHPSENTQIQTSTMRQRYSSPIPGFADREFVMTKKMTATENSDGTHSTVTFEIDSLDDELSESTGSAICNGCVRATNLGTKWIFTSLDDGKKTKIELEMAVDPKVPKLSAFFVNLTQKKWPLVSIRGLMKEARHHLGRDDEVQVANTFFRLFPLKT